MMQTRDEERGKFEAALARIADVPWYATVNDLIGGWSIGNVDKPASARNWKEGEIEIGGVLTEALACYIVSLHNARLSVTVPINGISLEPE